MGGLQTAPRIDGARIAVVLENKFIPEEIAAACRDYAVRAHQVLGCRGLSRSDFRWDDSRGLAGLMDRMEITALTDAQRKAMADVAQPAFEGHIRENLDAKAVELLDLMKTEVGAANQAVYLD